MKDYYSILQVDRNASQSTIKGSYRKLAAQYHPDVSNHPNATEKFQEISLAYQVLSHEGKRLMYDLSLADITAEPVVNTPRRTNTYRTPRPSSAATERSYDEMVTPYLKYSRYICRVAFAFCMFLFVDYYLPHRIINDKVAFVEKQQTAREGNTSGDIIIRLHTEAGTVFRLPKEKYDYFYPGEAVTIHRSLMANTDLYAIKDSHPNTFIRAFETIYSPKIFMVIVLSICSLIGGFKKSTPHGSFSYGVASAFLLIVVYALL